MWKDVTNYRRGERGEKEPTGWATQSGNVSITITCGHIYYPGEWIMHCRAIGVDTLPLRPCGSVEEAKKKAIDIVKVTLNNLSRDAENLSL